MRSDGSQRTFYTTLVVESEYNARNVLSHLPDHENASISLYIVNSISGYGTSGLSNNQALTSVTIGSDVEYLDGPLFNNNCSRLYYVENNSSYVDLYDINYIYMDPFEGTPWRAEHPLPDWATSTSTD